MAPELLTSAGLPREHQLHTNETDVWAFGMTTYVRFNYLGKGTTHAIMVVGGDVSGDAIFQSSR